MIALDLDYNLVKSLNVDTLFSENIEKLERQYNTIVQQIEDTTNTSHAQLWYDDGVKFREALIANYYITFL